MRRSVFLTLRRLDASVYRRASHSSRHSIEATFEKTRGRLRMLFRCNVSQNCIYRTFLTAPVRQGVEACAGNVRFLTAYMGKRSATSYFFVRGRIAHDAIGYFFQLTELRLPRLIPRQRGRPVNAIYSATISDLQARRKTSLQDQVAR